MSERVDKPWDHAVHAQGWLSANQLQMPDLYVWRPRRACSQTVSHHNTHHRIVRHRYRLNHSERCGALEGATYNVGNQPAVHALAALDAGNPWFYRRSDEALPGQGDVENKEIASARCHQLRYDLERQLYPLAWTLIMAKRPAA